MSAPLGPKFSRVVIRLFGQNDPPSLVKRRKTFVMFEVKRPFPTSLLGKPARITAGKWWSWPFVRLAGREWYFPSLLTLWRKGEVVSVQFVPWQNLRRWLFTRCEACGERLPYGSSPVSQLSHMHAPKTKSVMVGETGLYHWACAHRPDPQAAYGSTDMWDRSYGHDDGMRRSILHEPIDVAVELSILAQRRREAEDAYRKRLWETRKEHGLEPGTWKFPQPDEAPTPSGGGRHD